MARENEYLKAFQGKHVLAVGEKGTKKVSVKGLKPGTKYSDVKVAYDTTPDNNMSKEASEAVAVPEFTTKQTTTSTTTTTKKPTTTSTSTTTTTKKPETTSTTTTTKKPEPTTTSTSTTTKKPEEPSKPTEG